MVASNNNYTPTFVQIMSSEPMHAQIARNFTLKTTKDDLKMVERLVTGVDEEVPLYFTDRI